MSFWPRLAHLRTPWSAACQSRSGAKSLALRATVSGGWRNGRQTPRSQAPWEGIPRKAPPGIEGIETHRRRRSAHRATLHHRRSPDQVTRALHMHERLMPEFVSARIRSPAIVSVSICTLATTGSASGVPSAVPQLSLPSRPEDSWPPARTGGHSIPGETIRVGRAYRRHPFRTGQGGWQYCGRRPIPRVCHAGPAAGSKRTLLR